MSAKLSDDILREAGLDWVQDAGQLDLLNDWCKRAAALEAELEAIEREIAILCEIGQFHRISCPQFTGPYDLGELEPACDCGRAAAQQ